jgi:hypothetical protein
VWQVRCWLPARHPSAVWIASTAERGLQLPRHESPRTDLQTHHLLRFDAAGMEDCNELLCPSRLKDLEGRKVRDWNSFDQSGRVSAGMGSYCNVVLLLIRVGRISIELIAVSVRLIVDLLVTLVAVGVCFRIQALYDPDMWSSITSMLSRYLDMCAITFVVEKQGETTHE